MAEVFLVGGAVRDLVMGRTPKDFDFVVVGSSPEEMRSLGFEQVGNDFPVFLHPITGDEFALARTENTTGDGHTDFECVWEDVTLEEDLLRRDLTINAMALPTGKSLKDRHPDCFWWKVEDLIDPFNGLEAIKRKELAMVGGAFVEDPLRVLRVGRFLSRFGKDWTVEMHTWQVCKSMSINGKLDNLTPERVWKEMSRALMEDTPSQFFDFIRSISWDGMREVNALVGVEQRPDFHPEGDAFVHTMLCLDVAARDELTLEERFAVLCHDFGKRPAFEFNTAKGENHLGGHEGMGVPLIEAFCDKWKVPNDCRKLATLVARDHTHVHNLHKLKAKTIAKMFERWDLLRHPERAHHIALCCQADGRGRGEDFEDMEHPNFKRLLTLAAAWCEKVDVKLVNENRREPLQGKALGDAIRRVRVQRLSFDSNIMTILGE